MFHLSNIIYIISLALAIAVPVDAFFIYLRHKKKIIIYWLMFLVSLALFLTSICIEYYFEIFDLNRSAVNQTSEIVERGALALCVYSIPIFIHKLLGIKLTFIHKFMVNMVVTLALVSGFICTITPLPQLSIISFSTLLSVTISYCVVVGMLHLKEIGNLFIRKSLLTFLIVTAFFLPFLLYDIWNEDTIYSLSHSIYLIVVNICFLVFSYLYLNQPAFFDGDTVTKYFVNMYELTNREEDIVMQIIKGKTNRAIADELFISSKTVEAHISKIFKKTSVKNRVQLVNLVQTNRS